MNKIFILTSLILVFSFQPVLFARDNPFISKEPDEGIVRSVQPPAFIQKVLIKITPLQHKLSRRLTQLTREIKDTHSKGHLLSLFLSLFFMALFMPLDLDMGKQ